MHEGRNGSYNDGDIDFGVRDVTALCLAGIESRKHLQSLDDFLLLERVNVDIVGRGRKHIAVAIEEEVQVSGHRFSVLMLSKDNQHRPSKSLNGSGRHGSNGAKPRPFPADAVAT